MDVFSAIKDRSSARAFLDKPVSRETVEDLVTYAGMAPSAINLQPWEYIVTYGEEKDRLVRRLKKAQSERGIPCGPGTEKPTPPALFASKSRGLIRHAALDFQNRPSVQSLH